MEEWKYKALRLLVHGHDVHLFPAQWRHLQEKNIICMMKKADGYHRVLTPAAKKVIEEFEAKANSTPYKRTGRLTFDDHRYRIYSDNEHMLEDLPVGHR
jgi:hypothetical protein